MTLIINLLIGTVSVLIAAYLIPGVYVRDFLTAVIVAVVLGVLNTFIKPLLLLLTLPINILTMGLFTFVINVLLVMLASYLVPDFGIETIWAAILFSLVLSLVNSFLSMISR
jgi:putative membrane protein